MMETHERLRAVIEKVFPDGSRIVASPEEGEYVLLISWKIGTDPARPNKRSKTIRLAISEEILRGYARGGQMAREQEEVRLAEVLRQQLAAFDPSHDSPLGSAPPIEHWRLCTTELSG